MTRNKNFPPIPPIEDADSPPLEDADTVLAELSGDSPIEHTPELQAIAGNYCPNCKQKILTDLFNVPICPIALVGCPRNITP